MTQAKPLLSVVVPVLNEVGSLPRFHDELTAVLRDMPLAHEVLYIDDGSTDGSRQLLQNMVAEKNSRTKLLCLSRNVGKEIALTAGLREARGDAVLTIDADGQHPPRAIPGFIRAWQDGSMVVVGRRHERQASFVKRVGSRLFYGIFFRLFRLKLDPDSSDFRLIDRSVCDQVNTLTEHNRMTRSLIDWFGYEHAVVLYEERHRFDGDSPYTLRKLTKLAIDSTISHSTSPLYAVAATGAGILLLSSLLGFGMIMNFLLHDPLGLHAEASAYGLVLVLFLIGLLLVSQGIIGLYLAHIHAETQDRPLYVIDERQSRR